MQFLKKFFLAAAISTTAVSAQAGAVFGDWKVSGDNNAILHEETGIEWLRLNETDGMSVNYVLSQTGAGGEFAGWRMPTADEVSTFIGSFYPDYDTSQEYRRYSSQGYDDRFWPEHRRYRDVIGETAYRTGTNQYGTYYQSLSFGHHLDSNGNMLMSGTRHSNWGGSPRLYEFDIYNGDPVGRSADEGHVYFGVYLVSDGGVTLSSISDPYRNINNPNAPINQVPVALCGVALLGMVFRKSKSKI